MSLQCSDGYSAAELAWRASLKVVVGGSHLTVGLLSELVNAVSSVEGAADLLVSLNESLQLNGQVSVLVNEHVAMVLQSVDLILAFAVHGLHGLVLETQISLLTLCAVQLLFAVAALTLQLAHLGS